MLTKLRSLITKTAPMSPLEAKQVELRDREFSQTEASETHLAASAKAAESATVAGRQAAAVESAMRTLNAAGVAL